ncbi:MAG: anhydro-N-acetylmuramic acid kinase [Gammaproteobacteria bacterium]
MYYIGLMSGTSMDAIDAAIVDIGDTSLAVLDYRQYPISRDIQARVRAINLTSDLQEVTELDNIIGQLFADAVTRILQQNKISKDDIVATGSHGQTVLHLPDADCPRSWQIGDANIIAARSGITTVTDFRRADMAVSGQGAPLAPAFHNWYFGSTDKKTVVLNLGGIANLTLLYKDTILGFDSGPGNGLMDQWIQQHKAADYDKDGDWALSGRCDAGLLQQMLQYRYFALAPPKSTGRDEFNLQWINTLLEQIKPRPADEDIQATLLQLTIQSISEALGRYAEEAEAVIVCGGGIHNTALMQGLKTQLAGLAVSSSAEHGIEPDAVEAVTFAWLAKQRLAALPGNIPSVTGAARPVVLGAIYAP